MEVRITKILRENDATRVCFECACGGGVAQWNGPAPAVGDRRFVELSVDDPLAMGTDVRETDEPVALRAEENASLIVAEAAQVYGYGVSWFDLGCGSLDVEVTGEPPVVGQRYRTAAGALTLFDENL